MREADAVLFERCKAAENCVVLQGTVKNDSTLDYMRNVIGIIQAFVDKGAVGIMDPQTITLYAVGIMDPQTITLYASEFVNDFENEDYNNAYYEVEVVEEEWVWQTVWQSQRDYPAGSF